MATKSPVGVTLARSSLGIATIGLIFISFAVRLATLGSQSYWSDELFSVRESSGGIQQFTDYADVEIHTPAYALLLFAWVNLGRVLGLTGTSEAWTHLLSLSFVATGVLAAWSGLHRANVSKPGMWAALAAGSVSGFAMTYSLESRDYSLLLAASMASTAFSLAVIVQIRTDRRVRWWPWTLWALLGATTQVFGMLVVLAQAFAIAVFMDRSRWRSYTWPLARTVTLSVSVQLAWIVYGTIFTSGFADGARWIRAPTLQSVWLLLTSTFSSGDLRHDADGFTWRSPWGVGMVFMLVVLALVFRILWDQPGTSISESASSQGEETQSRKPRAEGEFGQERQDSDGLATVFFAMVAASLILVVSSVSQFIHIWTLRNMLVALPALVWALVFGLMWLARAPGAKTLMGWVVVGACAVSLAVSVATMQQPYKQDYRGFAEYVLHAHAINPDVRVASKGRRLYLSLAAQRPLSEFADVRMLARGSHAQEGEVIYSSDTRGAPDRTRAEANRLLDELGRSDCEIVPFVQMAVVHCGAPDQITPEVP